MTVSRLHALGARNRAPSQSIVKQFLENRHAICAAGGLVYQLTHSKNECAFRRRE
jgi:hypothetical protein